MKKLQALLSWTWTPFFALLCGALAVVLFTWALVPAEPTRLFGEPKKSSSPSALIKTTKTSALGATERMGASRLGKSTSRRPAAGGANRPIKNPIAGIGRAGETSAKRAKPARAKRAIRAKRIRQKAQPTAPKSARDDADEEPEEEEPEEEEPEEEATAEGPEEPKESDTEILKPRQQLLAPKLLKTLPFVQRRKK